MKLFFRTGVVLIAACCFILCILTANASPTGEVDLTDPIIITEPATPTPTVPIDTDPPETDPPETYPPETYPPKTKPPSIEETEPPVIDDPDDNDDDEPWVPPTIGDSDYDYDSAANHELYETDNILDDTLMKKEDWEGISLVSVDNKSSSAGSIFGGVKDNPGDGNEATWLLYMGTLCLILSAAGMTYFVISLYKQRKQLGLAGNNRNGRGGRPPRGGSAVHAASSNKQRGAADRRSSYGDDYGSNKKLNVKIDPDNIFNFDTADINLPRRRNTGGNRFRD